MESLISLFPLNYLPHFLLIWFYSGDFIDLTVVCLCFLCQNLRGFNEFVWNSCFGIHNGSFTLRSTSKLCPWHYLVAKSRRPSQYYIQLLKTPIVLLLYPRDTVNGDHFPLLDAPVFINLLSKLFIFQVVLEMGKQRERKKTPKYLERKFTVE